MLSIHLVGEWEYNKKGKLKQKKLIIFKCKKLDKGI